MTKHPNITFVDANILIAAATGNSKVSARAMEILDDPSRRFASSDLVKLETLPKAIYHGWAKPVEFYKEYFYAVTAWARDLNTIVDNAFDEATRHDIAPRDALHICAAVEAGASEFVTAEKPTKPMFETALIKVHSIHPNAD